MKGNFLLIEERRQEMRQMIITSVLVFAAAIAIYFVFDESGWAILGLIVSAGAAILALRKRQQMIAGVSKYIIFLGEMEHGCTLEFGHLPQNGERILVHEREIVSGGLLASSISGKEIEFLNAGHDMPTPYGEIPAYRINMHN